MSSKIKTGQNLAKVIDLLIEDSVSQTLRAKALQEKEKQQANTPQPAQKNSDSQQGSSSSLFDDENSKEPDTTSKTIDDESEKLGAGKVSVDDIIEKLNAIRSGRSFKDDAVYGSMTQYVDSLSKAEKVALLAFMKGISQIVTGVVPADSATDPGDNPADVEMQKGTPHKEKHVDPNVIKTSAVTPQKKKVEDTTSPAPITPKKR